MDLELYFTKRHSWSFLANLTSLFSHICVPFCQTGDQVPGKAPVRIPSSSLTEVWSAQTWTLGTLFTHIIVTCKPPCRKHKIHLYILNLQAMTAQTEQGKKKRINKRKEEKEGKKAGFEAGLCSHRQKCWDSNGLTRFSVKQNVLICSLAGKKTTLCLNTCVLDCRGSDFSPSSCAWAEGTVRGWGLGVLWGMRSSSSNNSSSSSSNSNSSSDVVTHTYTTVEPDGHTGTHAYIQTHWCQQRAEGFTSAFVTSERCEIKGELYMHEEGNEILLRLQE